jgi:hypothetical protein
LHRRDEINFELAMFVKSRKLLFLFKYCTMMMVVDEGEFQEECLPEDINRGDAA